MFLSYKRTHTWKHVCSMHIPGQNERVHNIFILTKRYLLTQSDNFPHQDTKRPPLREMKSINYNQAYPRLVLCFVSTEFTATMLNMFQRFLPTSKIKFKTLSRHTI